MKKTCNQNDTASNVEVSQLPNEEPINFETSSAISQNDREIAVSQLSIPVQNATVMPSIS